MLPLRPYAQINLPPLSFKENILSVPGYTFGKAIPWDDTGSMTLLAEGSSLKDGSHVLAKIATAQSNGSMCLEREAHILGRMASSSEASSTTLRVLDFFNIQRAHGDCVVLLLAHPGPNLLGRYFPPSKVNDLLLADPSRNRLQSLYEDVAMSGVDEPYDMEEKESYELMDLASFLEFGIQATHCLEVMHKAGLTHREVRANAFHMNAHSGLVRLVHFGNRAISLEQFGGPSALVFTAHEEEEKLKVKEALCYLAPEQTGSIDTMTQDYRTDLYSLGIMFWTLLVGRGQMPFEGGPLELLHSIVQKRPMPVHEVRRDTPQVIAIIIEKLLAKGPDARYQSAYGLRADLMECQRRLLATVSSVSEQSAELIPLFEIATYDRHMGFTMPIALFGREKELELVRSVIKQASTNFSRHFSSSKPFVFLGTDDESLDYTHTGNMEDCSETMSLHNNPLNLPQSEDTVDAASLSHDLSSTSVDNIAIHTSDKASRAQAVIVIGSPGVGKSSLILANQAKWRSHGLWGQAKFQNPESAPFAALLGCLSSVLRQLMVFHTDTHRFVVALKERLGPLLYNIPLLYQGTPELKDALALYGIRIEAPQESLATRELRARFQSLVENVFSVLSEIRLFALFLDDLHEADDSTLDLVKALVNARSRMLILVTLRSDRTEIVERLRSMFTSRSKPTWITVGPLPYSAISSLVSKTLHRNREDCGTLSRFIFTSSSGNAFAARSMLMTLQRQGHIVFEWDRNWWNFDMKAIEGSLANHELVSNPSDISFLIGRLRKLPSEARKYLAWASFFGSTFKVTEVSLMMDWEDSNGSDKEPDGHWNMLRAVSSMRDTNPSSSRASMRGLQAAVAEGWLMQHARDMCSFAHDRYRQAAQADAESLPEEVTARMRLKIILALLDETPIDVYRTAEHAKRCFPLLHSHPKRDEILEVLIDAGESAWARGAHELALQSFTNATRLLHDNTWEENPSRTLSLLSRLASLFTWKGDCEASDTIIQDCFRHVECSEDKAKVLRLRSRNHWMRNRFKDALTDTLMALHLLGVEVNGSPTKAEADAMFDVVKNEILAIGFEEILALPRATDPRTDLAVALLNEAGTNAYWSSGQNFSHIVGLTAIQLALRGGISPGTALGFFWTLGAAAERRELYRFSVDLGRLALRIAELHGTTVEKCRAHTLFAAMVSPFDNVHLRANIPRLEAALKYGHSAGDRVYTSLASIHTIMTKLFLSNHLSDLVTAAEECVNDVRLWAPGGDANVLATTLLSCVRALAGQTNAKSVDTAFDTKGYKESEYIAQARASSGNLPLLMNWFNSFKLVGLFCMGFVKEAAELGFSVYETRAKHPNHRHIRYSLFFHSLSLIACLRQGRISSDIRRRYLEQIDVNQNYIRKWLSPSPVNTGTWIALVDAELAALTGKPEALKLYDVAFTLASSNDWLLEEGWVLFLQGSYLVNQGVKSLGSELQRRGIARQKQWGAMGVANFMSSIMGKFPHHSQKRSTFSSDASVQTDSVMVGYTSPSSVPLERENVKAGEARENSSLAAADLAAILKWSKDVSSDINLASALRRLTEITTETSGSQSTCVVIAREAGDYTVTTSMVPPGACRVHDNPKSIRTINDPLQKAIIQHALNTKERIYYDDVAADPRFSSEAGQSPHRSVVCLPIFSNRGQTFGALYVASTYAFSQRIVTILTLLCQQASISISNALLFRSVQAGTRENLRMISAQREALEAARKSREDALKATKIKSNFLASMSHELRTPFSSFYGLLDLLSGTELNPGQSEIVQTAKQSCELLLKIIDSILDYSKLEASAVKLEYSGFSVENIIADCMELLLPMAAKKLDLSFNIEPDVPAWVTADYARIRQVLMNLIGNAVKFTANGSVRIICSVDKSKTCAEANGMTRGDVSLKFVIQDSGIGLSLSDVDLLFVPFQQADNSSTRRFGGTGLGLSISRQLVKLMGGAIGVQSELNHGSTFWFTIPVKICNTEEAQKALREITELRAMLLETRALRIFVCSSSPTTATLLKTMLSGFSVTFVSSIHEAEAYLRTSQLQPPLDFLILDDQSETHADELAHFLHSLPFIALRETKLIHLYTPTTDSLSGHPLFRSSTPGVFKLTKPPRTLRLLRTLANLKHLTNAAPSHIQSAAVDNARPTLPHRTLYGNVLIAEDNPVAQQLLARQLQQFELNVTATSNGVEALAEWESHPPGHFTLALFDHHMPVCDGVEATKQIRLLENERKTPVSLPIVALSADCQESTKQLCSSAGMNAFFSKPLRKNDLHSLLTMFGATSDPK